MTPLQRYQRDLELPDFVHDPAQSRLVEVLQDLFDRLGPEPIQNQSRLGLVERLRGRTPVRVWQPAPKGLYLWGSVGRGKTYLVDNFYECVPDSHKVSNASVDADWPDATASVPGRPIAVMQPPSSALSRASSAPWVGFIKRV